MWAYNPDFHLRLVLASLAEYSRLRDIAFHVAAGFARGATLAQVFHGSARSHRRTAQDCRPRRRSPPPRRLDVVSSTMPACARALPVRLFFPQDAQQVSQIMRAASAAHVPVVGRGAGTGLSGGAIVLAGGIVIVFSRMNRVLEVDAENLRAVVQPGVVNLQLSEYVSHLGLYFAPDPSSQKACTIGGDVAENSGGPHTLMHGVTVNHVTGVELVLPSGEIVQFGGKAAESFTATTSAGASRLRRGGRHRATAIT